MMKSILAVLAGFCVMAFVLAMPVVGVAKAADEAAATGAGDVSTKQIYYEPGPSTPDKPKKLGLKYKILLQDGDGNLDEVTDKHVFHSGDRLRFAFEGNTDGYLYVFHKSSSSNTGVRLFPDKRIYDGKNFVKRYSGVTIPSSRGGWWRFDDNPGKESLFIFFSPKPITNLAGLVPGAQELDEKSWSTVNSTATTEEGKMGTRQIYYEEPGENAPPSSGYVVGEGQILVHTITLRHE